MKPTYSILLGMLFSLFLIGCSRGTAELEPRIRLEAPLTYDFGSINAKDGVVSAVLPLKNTGSEILEILGVSTSCGCTTAEVDKEQLKPGEEASLTIAFDPNAHEGLTGALERIVYIRTNNIDDPETQVKIKVEVREEEK